MSMNTNSALIVPAQSPAATNAAPPAFRDAIKPLIAIPNGWLWFFWIAGILALAAAGWSRRVLALGGLISVVVLAGVFLPTLSIQVFNDSFAAAVFIVLVVWAVVSLLRLSPAVALAGRAMAAGWRRVAAPPKQPPPAAPPASQPGPSAGGPGNA